MDTNEKKNSQLASQLQSAGGEIVLYQPDKNIRLEVQLDPDSQTVWLSQAQIGQLYGKAKSTISEHLTQSPIAQLLTMRIPLRNMCFMLFITLSRMGYMNRWDEVKRNTTVI